MITHTAKAAEIVLALRAMGWEGQRQFFTLCYPDKSGFARCKIKGHSALFYRYQYGFAKRLDGPGGRCMDFTKFYYRSPDVVRRAIEYARTIAPSAPNPGETGHAHHRVTVREPMATLPGEPITKEMARP